MSQAFAEYCSFFHQDIFEIHDTLETAIEDNISALMPDMKKELQAYLQEILNREDSLKNMDIGNLGFSNVQGLRYFLEQSLIIVQKQTQ